LIAPRESLEKAAQMIKGGFSFRAKRELGWTGDIWIAGFSDHRIRDDEDFEVHRRYIARNPVEAGLAVRGEEFAYCSANGKFELDEFPRGLKPRPVGLASGAAEAAPFQGNNRHGEQGNRRGAEQDSSEGREAEGNLNGGTARASSLRERAGR
jgi:putative transposase